MCASVGTYFSKTYWKTSCRTKSRSRNMEQPRFWRDRYTKIHSYSWRKTTTIEYSKTDIQIFMFNRILKHWSSIVEKRFRKFEVNDELQLDNIDPICSKYILKILLALQIHMICYASTEFVLKQQCLFKQPNGRMLVKTPKASKRKNRTFCISSVKINSGSNTQPTKSSSKKKIILWTTDSRSKQKGNCFSYEKFLPPVF